MTAPPPPSTSPTTVLRFARKREQRGRPVVRMIDNVVVAWLQTAFLSNRFTAVDDGGRTLCEATPARFRDAVRLVDAGGEPLAALRREWGRDRVDLPDGTSLSLRRDGMFGRDWTLSDAAGVPVLAASYPSLMSGQRGDGYTVRIESPVLSLAQAVGIAAAHTAAEERRRRRRSSGAAGAAGAAAGAGFAGG